MGNLHRSLANIAGVREIAGETEPCGLETILACSGEVSLLR